MVKVVSVTKELFLPRDLRFSARINLQMLVDGIYMCSGEGEGSFNLLCENLQF